MFIIYFTGGPNDREHRWAVRETADEACDVAEYLENIKDVWSTVICWHETDPMLT